MVENRPLLGFRASTKDLVGRSMRVRVDILRVKPTKMKERRREEFYLESHLFELYIKSNVLYASPLDF